MLTLTCCQDHILTENIWFVCSETSYSGDERRCHRCGTTDRPITEDRATQPMEAGGWVSQKQLIRQISQVHRGVWSCSVWPLLHLRRQVPACCFCPCRFSSHNHIPAPFLAEWLDNDEDGCADNPLVVSKVTFPFFLFLFSSLKCPHIQPQAE